MKTSTTYTPEEMKAHKRNTLEADKRALNMIIERVKDYNALNGVDRDLHEALARNVEIIYSRLEDVSNALYVIDAEAEGAK